MNKKIRKLKFAKTKGDVAGQGSRNLLSRPMDKTTSDPGTEVNRADMAMSKLIKSNNKKSPRVRLVKRGKLK